MISQIDATQFDAQVANSNIPVLIEFFSDHCGWCEALLPVLGEIAGERPDKLQIYKFNAGNDPQFASRFRISSVPNLILFRGGTPVGQRTGYAPKRDLVHWIDSTLS
jgi:thioredoxin